MPEELLIVIIVYFGITSLFAIAITVYDKIAAKLHRRRIPEKVLLLTAAFSGCVAMYVTMQIIRHKTRHKKFMVGIPMIFVTELIAAFGVYYAFGYIPFLSGQKGF